ncbi:MAG: glycosyltransferase family 2 protein [Nanoarchaeota archaeon]
MLSIAIPCYNEEEIIGKTVSDLVGALKIANVSYELILVDNGSFDKTPIILKKLANRHIRILTLDQNRGFGGGVIAGLKEGTGDYISFTCADGQVSPEEIIRLYKIAQEKDVAVVKGDRRKNYKSFFRRFVSRCYHLFVMLLFPVRVHDVNGYPILFRKDVLKAIHLSVNDWIIQVQMLSNVTRKGYKIVELPITYYERKGGRSHIKFSSIFTIFFQLIRYRIWRTLHEH